MPEQRFQIGLWGRALDTGISKSDRADFIVPLENLCCVSVSTHKNNRNASGKITQGEGGHWLSSLPIRLIPFHGISDPIHNIPLAK